METTRYLYRVDRTEIAYLRMTLESYDGMAVVSTADPGQGLVQVRVSPGCEELINALLQDLSEHEGIGLAACTDQ